MILPLQRAALISGIVTVGKQREFKRVAASAAYDAAGVAPIAGSLPFASPSIAAVSTAAAAAALAADDDDSFPVRVAYFAAPTTFATSSKSAAKAAARDQQLIEAGSSLAKLPKNPLWSEGKPQEIDAALKDLHAFWDAAPEVWGFWRRWYDGMLAGAPLDRELQRRVALIPDEVWQAGPEAVAAAIRKIELGRRTEVLPRLERD
jgi:hypothetical protein